MMASLRRVEDSKPEAPRFGFLYENPSRPELAEMRKRERLDEVVDGAKDDWDIISRLSVWTCGRVKLGAAEKSVDSPSGCGLLKQIDAGYGGACCGTFNRIFQSALSSFGILARDLNTGSPRTRINNGSAWHAVTDAWSGKWGKWVYLDSEFALHYENAGVPMSAIEIQRSIHSGRIPERRFFDGGKGIAKNIKACPGLQNWLDYYTDLFQNVDVVMASDHLSEDWKESRIADGRHEGAPRVYCREPEMSATPAHEFPSLHYVRTSNAADLYWPVNTIGFKIPAEGASILLEGSSANIKIASHAPFIESLMLRVDGGDWTSLECYGDASLRNASFKWILHPGENKLEAKVESAHGRSGAISSIVAVAST